VLLRQSLDDLAALSGRAAETLSIPEAAFVEKDFWVVEMLRSLARPLPVEPIGPIPASAEVLFKGGTSLSKAYGLIDRFSEDVDILVVCLGLGKQATETRVLRPLCDRVTNDLGLADTDVKWLDYDRGETRNARYHYPRRLPSAAITDGVKLEMGVRGGTLPGTIVRSVRSYIAEYVDREDVDAEFDDLASVDIGILAPVRTLAEKLALLHHAGTAAVRGEGRALSEAGRHFYDVHQLLCDDGVVMALGSNPTMAEIAADVDANSKKHRWPFTPRPDEGYGTSLVFDPRGQVRRAAEESFSSALRLVWGPRPTFDECLASIARHTKLL
jgi:Nucleotidyl transferase AbiEii toxin, Type IV TA system